MFTFVLSSGIGGGGDFFDQVGRFFGGSRSPHVATIDGKKVYAEELSIVQRKRQIANEYMSQASGRVASNILRRITQLAEKDIVLKQLAENIIRDRYMFYAMMAQFGVSEDQALRRHLSLLDLYVDRANNDKKQDVADALKSLQNLLRHDMTQVNRMDGEMYFGGTIRTGEGIVDFLTWLSVADKRGIKLTDETVRKLIVQETLGELTDEDAVAIEKAVIGRRQLGPKFLMEAFADEFRVWIAQTALIGQSSARSNIPSFSTPYELKKDYTDKRTAVRVNLLSLNVDDYLAKVTDKPTETEIKALYDKYKNIEWQPTSETPGFKEPKRVKLEYVSGKAGSAIFRKAGAEQAKQDAIATATLPFAIGVPPLGGVIAPLGGLTAAIHKIPELPETKFKTEYEYYTSRQRSVPWSDEQFYGFRIHDTSVVHPHVYASTIASAFGSFGTGAPTLTPAMTFVGQAAVQEVRDRIRIGLSGFAGGSANLWAVAGLPDGAITPPLALNVVRSQLSETIDNDLARAAFEREMRKFSDELTKRSKDLKKPDPKKPATPDPVAKDAKKPDAKDVDPKKALQDYIAETVKKLSLQRGGSAELRDRFSLIQDAGIKSLADIYNKEMKKEDPKGYRFAPEFFSDTQNGGSELFAPKWYDAQQRWFSPGPGALTGMDEELFVVWKVEETDAKVRTLEQARADIEMAWKRAKARELAKAAADETAKKFQKLVEDKKLKDFAALQAEFKDFAAANKFKAIELEPLPLFTMQLAVMPGSPTQYQRGTVSREAVPDATQDFATKLTDMRKKPLGESIVLHDSPKSQFYVAILLGIDGGSDFDFRQAYAKAAPSALSPGDSLLMGYDIEQRVMFRRDFIKQLRKDARVETVAEELKKYDDTRAGGGDE
jgi:hypothetical protein